MKSVTVAVTMLAALPVLAIGAAPADAKGCLKGAVVGGVVESALA